MNVTKKTLINIDEIELRDYINSLIVKNIVENIVGISIIDEDCDDAEYTDILNNMYIEEMINFNAYTCNKAVFYSAQGSASIILEMIKNFNIEIREASLQFINDINDMEYKKFVLWMKDNCEMDED